MRPPGAHWPPTRQGKSCPAQACGRASTEQEGQVSHNSAQSNQRATTNQPSHNCQQSKAYRKSPFCHATCRRHLSCGAVTWSSPAYLKGEPQKLMLVLAASLIMKLPCSLDAEPASVTIATRGGRAPSPEACTLLLQGKPDTTSQDTWTAYFAVRNSRTKSGKAMFCIKA